MLFGAISAGLVFGLYFTLVGLGLNLIFGVMRIVNLAHGDFLMLGGFAAYFLFYLLGLHPLVAAVAVLVVFFLAGLPIYYLIVPRLLLARDAEMLSVILFFGLSQVIEALTAICLRYHRTLDPRPSPRLRAGHHTWPAAAQCLGVRRRGKCRGGGAGLSVPVSLPPGHADPRRDGQP